MKRIIISLTGLGLFLLCYYLIHKNNQIMAYWGQKTERLPASVLSQLRPEFKIYKEFFSYPSLQKKMRYDISVDLKTDIDEEYLKNRANIALHDAFRLTFEKLNEAKENEKGASFLGVFKEGLVESFVDHFIKTITVLKIVNKTFQIDFNFVPHIQKDLNYNEELSSNQLIQWNNTGSLYQELTSDNLNLQEKILKTERPSTKDLFEYQGGQISIWLKILDMSPTLKLPQTKKNAMKGFLRLRRYYKANNIASLSPFISASEFSIKSLGVEFEKNYKNFFITVDVFKEFSLNNPVPSLDRMEIHFGTLMPDQLYKNNLIGKLITNNLNSIKVGTLKIKGKFTAEDKQTYPFESDVNRLTYDFEKKGFDLGNSSISSTIKTPVSYNPNNEATLHHQFNQILLKKFSAELIKGLHLNEFHDELGGAL